MILGNVLGNFKILNLNLNHNPVSLNGYIIFMPLIDLIHFTINLPQFDALAISVFLQSYNPAEDAHLAEIVTGSNIISLIEVPI